MRLDDIKKLFFEALTSAGVASKDSLDSVKLNFTVCTLSVIFPLDCRKLTVFLALRRERGSNCSLNIRHSLRSASEKSFGLQNSLHARISALFLRTGEKMESWTPT